MDGRNERGQIRQEVWLKEEAAVRRTVPEVREEKGVKRDPSSRRKG